LKTVIMFSLTLVHSFAEEVPLQSCARLPFIITVWQSCSRDDLKLKP
jgi:hypothetical protein